MFMVVNPESNQWGFKLLFSDEGAGGAGVSAAPSQPHGSPRAQGVPTQPHGFPRAQVCAGLNS